MISVALIGANGYVGKALYNALISTGKYNVTGVVRENYDDVRKTDFDIIINSAMPSARFKAKNNPKQDFIDTVEKTADIVYGWKYKKLVQISTVSARCQLDTVYGRHKAAAENLCDFGDNLIIRLGPMYDRDLKKGVLVDMVNGKKVFVNGDSRYCFTALDFVSRWIASNLNEKGLIEVGASNAISLKDVAKHLGKVIEFEGVLDHQEISRPRDDWPTSSAVLTFLDNWHR